jgi:hypothetical protein
MDCGPRMKPEDAGSEDGRKLLSAGLGRDRILIIS